MNEWPPTTMRPVDIPSPGPHVHERCNICGGYTLIGSDYCGWCKQPRNTPTEQIQKDLEYHPTFIGLLKDILEKNYNCEVDYDIANPFAFMGLGWNNPPTITPKGGD